MNGINQKYLEVDGVHCGLNLRMKNFLPSSAASRKIAKGMSASHKRELQQPLVHFSRRLLHDAGRGLFGAQGESGKHVGAQVDQQDLEDRERQKDVEQDIAEVRHRLGDVRRKDRRRRCSDC